MHPPTNPVKLRQANNPVKSCSGLHTKKYIKTNKNKNKGMK